MTRGSRRLPATLALHLPGRRVDAQSTDGERQFVREDDMARYRQAVVLLFPHSNKIDCKRATRKGPAESLQPGLAFFSRWGD